MFSGNGYLLVLFGFTMVKMINCFTDGTLLESVCQTMEIMHGLNPESSPVPFRVTPEELSVGPSQVGTSFSVTLTADSERSFRGFMLEARQCDNCAPAGTFSGIDTSLSVLICSDQAVAQFDSTEKTIVTVSWRPTAAGQYFFRYFHDGFIFYTHHYTDNKLHSVKHHKSKFYSAFFCTHHYTDNKLHNKSTVVPSSALTTTQTPNSTVFNTTNLNLQTTDNSTVAPSSALTTTQTPNSTVFNTTNLNLQTTDNSTVAPSSALITTQTPNSTMFNTTNLNLTRVNTTQYESIQYMRGGLALLLFSRLCFLGGSSLLMVLKPVSKLPTMIASPLELACKIIASILLLAKVLNSECLCVPLRTSFIALTVTTIAPSLVHSITVFIHCGLSHELWKCWVCVIIIVDIINTAITTVAIFFGMLCYRGVWIPIIMAVYVVLELLLYVGAIICGSVKMCQIGDQNIISENKKSPWFIMFILFSVFNVAFSVVLIAGVSSVEIPDY
ncbi:hypothetical protein DNTS_031955 [Danionella cerebrum]|uniref:Reelin domain-containing protein n=1 Tax=Danionella cerebrum TaxID=2873325 RepID=A0A553PEF0_9TELE|nr:hypothetical protein DNTS_031955 [Danionella translucida]